MRTVVVAGALANKPGNGGEAWVRMSWVRGLARLGFDVWFAEALSGEATTDAAVASRRREAIRFFDEVAAANGLADRSVLLQDGVPRGLAVDEWNDLAAGCDLLVNISGHLKPDDWFYRIPRRVYVDLDPGYTQIWDSQGLLGDQLAAHTHHYSVGLNVGRAVCDLPTGGHRWRPTLQPVVLDDWDTVAPCPDVAKPTARTTSSNGVPYPGEEGGVRFTTVASWRGAFGPIDFENHSYGVKAHEWRRFRALPALAPDHVFEAALAIHPADEEDRDILESAGWRLEDPADRAGSPEAFRSYVTESDAEFSVAQGVYVDTRSGWFSDRSARYLAAGRPVVVQDTGFGDTIRTSRGIVAFETIAEAVDGIDSIANDYETHSRAARRIAEEHFDSDVVLGALLEDVALCP